MSRLLLLLMVAAALLGAATTAAAAPRALRYAEALRAAGGSVTIPPEWDGIWASEDSVYDCEGAFQSVESYFDTLCAGQVYAYADEPFGGMFTITCSGTATATTAHVTCSASGEVMTDCLFTFDNEFDAIRTGDTFVAVSITNMGYSGTAEGCNLIPGSCTRIVTRATRISPAPTDYCLTPTRSATWGELRVRYR